MPSFNHAVQESGSDSLPFAFLRVELKLKFGVLSRPHKFGPAICMCSLFVCQSFLLPLLSLSAACTGSQPQGRMGVGKLLTALRVPVNHWEGTQVRHPQWLLGGFLRDAVNTTVLPSECLLCCSPSLCMPPGHAAQDLGLWMREKGLLWQHFTQLGKLGAYSRVLSFLRGRNHGPRGTHGNELCCPGGGVMWVKSNCFSYHANASSAWGCFFLQWRAGPSLLET